MRKRCTPGDRDFQKWGARGISVCDRWQIFENFLADMGFRPSSEHSLDRIDNAGNYEPSNCRWATWKVQAANRRKYLALHNFTDDELLMECKRRGLL